MKKDVTGNEEELALGGDARNARKCVGQIWSNKYLHRLRGLTHLDLPYLRNSAITIARQAPAEPHVETRVRESWCGSMESFPRRRATPADEPVLERDEHAEHQVGLGRHCTEGLV